MGLKIVDASWHRNGVGGAGFYAIIFDDKEEGRMVAALFDHATGAGEPCAVFKISELAKNNIAFAQDNSWRGDQYAEELCPLLKKFLGKKGTNRLGPFGVADRPVKDV